MAKSPVIRLVDLIWENAEKATGHSWTRLNTALHQSVTLAIEAGLKFAVGDFEHILRNYNSGFWRGEGGGEYWYSRAVECHNISACQSFEIMKERKPFILGGKRLAIGTRIDSILDRREMLGNGWLPLQWAHTPAVEVGSFFADGTGFNCFSKFDTKKDEWSKKPVRRFRVGRDQIATANALLRSDEKAREEANKKQEVA